LLRKWLAKLPHPYTAKDRKVGHRYQVSILQAEFSRTRLPCPEVRFDPANDCPLPAPVR
jgi:hypothetical protein